METQNKTAILKGGEFLIKETNPQDVFTPEDFTEEQKMMMDMCHQFLQTEVYPLLDRIYKLDP